MTFPFYIILHYKVGKILSVSLENLESKRMCLNKLPLLKAMRNGPSWHKILKILQKPAI